MTLLAILRSVTVLNPQFFLVVGLYAGFWVTYLSEIVVLPYL